MSFSVTTLRGFINKISSGGGGAAPAAPVFSLSVGCYGLEGTISTVTEGATIRWTNDGTDPTCSTGNEIACETATILGEYDSAIPGACEDVISIALSPSTTTVKAIACLDGVASSVTSDTFGYTCPTSIGNPGVSASCPNGQGAFGCNNGVINFNVTYSGDSCVFLAYTIQEGSYPADPTRESFAGTLSESGGTITYNGTTSGFGIQVYIKVKAFSINTECNTESTVTSFSYGYQYP